MRSETVTESVRRYSNSNARLPYIFIYYVCYTLPGQSFVVFRVEKQRMFLVRLTGEHRYVLSQEL